MSNREGIAQVVQDNWVTVSDLLRLLMINEQMSNSLKKIWLKLYFWYVFLFIKTPPVPNLPSPSPFYSITCILFPPSPFPFPCPLLPFPVPFSTSLSPSPFPCPPVLLLYNFGANSTQCQRSKGKQSVGATISSGAQLCLCDYCIAYNIHIVAILSLDQKPHPCL